ncbi:DUF485 domain-containing protein [Actinoalloteichus caeruleus]|uniref:DUF485 domain-containing protein n=1 Tax=Actinoalloteichus cyanogriseus TaxID=2893586 RepID=UPI0004A9E283|nr:DUF485 domain-containing protein [Actinoalloteichus caeruleus]
MSTTPPDDGGPSPTTWHEAHESPDFVELRRRLRTFVFPTTGLFLTWYLLYVVLADYAHGLMSIRVLGNVNLGLLLGLLQFVTTFLITVLYIRFANRRLDPLAEAVRERVEGGRG